MEFASVVLFLTGAAWDAAPRAPIDGVVEDEGGNAIDIAPGPDPDSFGVWRAADWAVGNG